MTSGFDRIFQEEGNEADALMAAARLIAGGAGLRRTVSDTTNGP